MGDDLVTNSEEVPEICHLMLSTDNFFKFYIFKKIVLILRSVD